MAEQLASTQRMAEDLVEAQSAALKSQEAILRNGEELKTTLQHSAKGNFKPEGNCGLLSHTAKHHKWTTHPGVFVLIESRLCI